MHPSIATILKNSTRKKDSKLNIITFSTHERYQSNMSCVDATFWTINTPELKLWNKNFAPVPKNHILINNVYNITDLPQYAEYDAVLSQSKYTQFQLAQKISNFYKIPLISVEHTEMVKERIHFKEMIGDANIFISEFSAKSWEPNYNYYVIEHGVDNKIFYNKNIKRKNVILSVVNDWINRDLECGYYDWKEITKDLPTFVVGNTPNLSQPAKTTDDLVNFYNTYSIFLNTSIHSPIPTTLLEAMSCGCCVITTENQMISSVIQNGINGFVSNNKEELRKYLEICLKDGELCKKIGKNARDTIIKRFCLNNFTKNWNIVLRKTLEN